LPYQSLRRTTDAAAAGEALKKFFPENGVYLFPGRFDDEAEAARGEVARTDGVHLGPEGAACFTAYRQELKRGRVGPRDRVVLFNCASGLKSDMPPVDRRLDRFAPIDFRSL